MRTVATPHQVGTTLTRLVAWSIGKRSGIRVVEEVATPTPRGEQSSWNARTVRGIPDVDRATLAGE